MSHTDSPSPTERELEILKVLWDQGEATVRQVHQRLAARLPIVQNTVQAFLRTMEQKGLVEHRSQGRSFIYRATQQREPTSHRLLSGLMERVFDGSVDQLVQSALSIQRPTPRELQQLKALLAKVEAAQGEGAEGSHGDRDEEEGK